MNFFEKLFIRWLEPKYALFHQVKKHFIDNPEALYLIFEISTYIEKQLLISKAEWDAILTDELREHNYSKLFSRVIELQDCYNAKGYIRSVFADPENDASDWIKQIRNKLRPGLGYKYYVPSFDCGIATICITANEVLYRDNVIIDELINQNDYLKIIPEQRKFEPDMTYVADESVIKRQHRPNTDYKRWAVIKELKVFDDPWVFSITPTDTGKGPTRYYGLEIDVDSKAMAGMTINLDDLVDATMSDILTKLDYCRLYDTRSWIGAHVKERIENVVTVFNGLKTPIGNKLSKQINYPVTVDTEPFYYTRKYNDLSSSEEKK